MTTKGQPPVRIAVDIGGTFTDLQIFDARSGAITSLKTPTTPEDPSLGLMTGIKEAAARDGFALADIGYLLHGTTIATNAVLERKLAKGALVTTARFEDVLEIGRHYRREIYALNPQVPPALIPRDRRIGIEERIRADGSVEMALSEAALEGLAAKLDALDVTTVAICLLNSYVNSQHESAIAEYLARTRPALKVSCSSALNAEIREYERTSTTVLNALLMPVIASYLDKLAHRMRAENCTPRLLLVQSNGGVCSTETAAQEPVRLLLSGPSGGSAACELLSQVLGEANIVGVDMGGTSFDVSVVRDGRVNLVTQGEIDKMPVRLPMVEIRTIGAGGGSIATVRAGGRLTVGPESAGSRPGPACYGRGGSEPTVTDANLALGRLDGEGFLGGGMRLDVAAARQAIEAHVAQPLGLGVEAAAEGLLAVTNANLGAAIRLSLFEKGLDPRDFVMIAFGGAAGLHAIAVADELGIRRVVFPESASTLSAYGILHSNLAHDLVRSKVLAADARQSRNAGRHGRQHAAGSQGAARCRCRAGLRPPDRAGRRHALQGPGLRADRAGAGQHAGRRHAGRADRRLPRHPPPALLVCQSRLAGRDRVAARVGRSAACRRPRARPRRCTASASRPGIARCGRRAPGARSPPGAAGRSRPTCR